MTYPKAIGFGILAVAAFHLAYRFQIASPLVVVFLYSLIRLGELPTARIAFYTGLAVGVGIYAPQLGFFWTIFGTPAVTLWLVLAFWIGLFMALVQACRQRLRPLWAAVWIPILWVGLEFFRSELYYLRFSWLTPALALSGTLAAEKGAALGTYGMGFCLAAAAGLISVLPMRLGAAVGGVFIAGLSIGTWPTLERPAQAVPSGGFIRVAGVQVEFPIELEVPALLDRALHQTPDAQLFMLSEYAFDGPVPKKVKEWCRRNQRYLVAGGKDAISATEFYNTAFVIGPSGEVVFQQVKSVPIQFFKDGLPAPEQRLWDSPWGKLGICICYDLSYSRVTDELIRQGARALLVPTMDVIDWGKHQHALHGRVAPMRAAEYQVSILRVTSSGESQLVRVDGTIAASIPFGCQEQVLSGFMELAPNGRLPLDRWFAPVAVAFTGLFSLWLLLKSRLIPDQRPQGLRN